MKLISLLTFSAVAAALPNGLMPSFFEGIGRSRGWSSRSSFQPAHPWERSRMLLPKEAPVNYQYDLEDGFQGDDFAAWMDTEESSELKDLVFDLEPVTLLSAPSTEALTLIQEDVTNSVIRLSQQSGNKSLHLDNLEEDGIVSTPAQPIWKVSSSVLESKKSISEELNVAISTESEAATTEFTLSSYKINPVEVADMESSPLSHHTLKDLTTMSSNALKDLPGGPVMESRNSDNLARISAGELADRIGNAPYSSPKYFFTRKPHRDPEEKLPEERDLEVELRAAETIRRKLFRNTEQRPQHLAPIDVAKFARKNFDDGDFVRLKSRMENLNSETLQEQPDYQLPKFIRTEPPVEVLVAIPFTSRSQFSTAKRPQTLFQTTVSPITHKTKWELDAENGLYAVGEILNGDGDLDFIPRFESLADLFPTISPITTTAAPKHRTRLPYNVGEQILRSIKRRRGKGRNIIPPDYSPLPYGIDYRNYDGPKSSIAKLRFQGEPSDYFSTTHRNVRFDVPDSESSDTGKLNEVYRFVGRKPKPKQTIQHTSERPTTPPPSAVGFQSVISFFQSLLRTRSVPPSSHPTQLM